MEKLEGTLCDILQVSYLLSLDLEGLALSEEVTELSCQVTELSCQKVTELSCQKRSRNSLPLFNLKMIAETVYCYSIENFQAYCT